MLSSMQTKKNFLQLCYILITIIIGRVVAGRCQRPATTRPTTLHVCKTRGCWCSFRLLMTGGVSPEACWASYKSEIKILIHCCILLNFLYEFYFIIMSVILDFHAQTTIKFALQHIEIVPLKLVRILNTRTNMTSTSHIHSLYKTCIITSVPSQ